MANNLIYEEIKKAGLFQYEVADALGVSAGTLIIWLRKPLDEAKRLRVLNAIATAKSVKEENVIISASV